jgi:hypothetical protein
MGLLRCLHFVQFGHSLHLFLNATQVELLFSDDDGGHLVAKGEFVVEAMVVFAAHGHAVSPKLLNDSGSFFLIEGQYFLGFAGFVLGPGEPVGVASALSAVGACGKLLLRVIKAHSKLTDWLVG